MEMGLPMSEKAVYRRSIAVSSSANSLLPADLLVMGQARSIHAFGLSMRAKQIGSQLVEIAVAMLWFGP